MRDDRTLKVRWIVAMALTAVLLGLAMGAVRAPDAEAPPVLRPREMVAAMRAPDFNPGMADTSLTIREHADFLLTPALLVQEALSDDIVLTYPEE